MGQVDEEFFRATHSSMQLWQKVCPHCVTLGLVKTSVQMGQVRCSRRGDTRIALPAIIV